MKIWMPLMIMAVVMAAVGCSLPKINLFPEAGPLKEVTLEGTGDEKILVLSIQGSISDQPKEKLLRTHPSMVQEVISQLKRAEKDPQIKAVLMKVNSPGGTVTASDILYHEIRSYKERSGVKLIVAMMNVAASGGYYISLPADWIMAHPTTITGSIGVIFSRPGLSGFMEKLGLALHVSKSGELKDMGSPFRAPTETDKAIFQALTDQMAERFVNLVLEHRSISTDQQQRITSARVFLANEAQQVGLIDQIGYLTDAIDKAKSLADLSPDAKVVTYRRYQSEDDNIYNPAVHQLDANGIKSTALSALSAVQEAGFYYIWPAAIGH
jgi:protease-4